jgi:hypothetical protein
MKAEFKYEAKIHSRPNSDDPKFIGTVKANSIAELKEKAKSHARSWNEHGGRLHLQDDNTGREWIINS